MYRIAKELRLAASDGASLGNRSRRIAAVFSPTVRISAPLWMVKNRSYPERYCVITEMLFFRSRMELKMIACVENLSANMAGNAGVDRKRWRILRGSFTTLIREAVFGPCFSTGNTTKTSHFPPQSMRVRIKYRFVSPESVALRVGEGPADILLHLSSRTYRGRIEG